MSNKTNPGNYFEDFSLGQEIVHATPRTLSEGDASLYTALYGTRFAVHSSDMFAMSLGFEAAPIDDMLAFNVVFGKTVPDISLNAVANLGYAAGRFGVPVYPGDTLRASSRVIGLKENSNAKTGIVFVHSVGHNQRDEPVLDFIRWVMVNKRDPASPAPEPVVPELPVFVADEDLIVPDSLEMGGFDTMLSGSDMLWDDYQTGEKIDHVDGMTIEESDHMLATRLYQNTAKVHFNQHTQKEGRFGRRIVYGGHVISLARALSFNGLGNAFKVAAINGGNHVAPTFGGDTIYAWSEVLGKSALSGHDDLGALRLRTVASKDQACENFPDKGEDGKYDPSVVLDFDYTVLIPKRC
ncbi:MAG: MaoC family dehydratase [Rhodospirillaceae bacterium]|jgi:2-methylfumaryl-CoA hydratase|nr:MaoC family dehydratase [Rhodospirillaceae bacterium]MBT5243747.1 MaoC family dehydratase [Rhodospirillaceae bacterium]MBT5563844.1 MaoC family dehydratase [Rhodospirillaceae bacterium]MBT6241667.1 MaoC family dehydratase [Rhodospirillaceae bacterium]MBT7138157.1 MaoC family dehydratase [Rhodospirillaceae bacterium]